MSTPRRSFLKRHSLISIGVLVLSILIGTILAAPVVLKLSIFRPDLNGHPVLAIAEVLDYARNSRQPEDIIRGLSVTGSTAGDYFILNESGMILAGPAERAPVIDPRFFPREPGQVAMLHGLSPVPGEPAGIRLRGEPVRYLVFRPHPRLGPEQFVVFAVAAVLTLVVIVAMTASTAFLLRKLRVHARDAEGTMKRIMRGELGARLAPSAPDEFGALVDLFNVMAGEVEGQFTRARHAERRRVELLQELAHDLRTPLASLDQILDLLIHKAEHVSEFERTKFLRSARGETNFTRRLVEDLLFLARVEDTSCALQVERFDLSALIQEVVDDRRASTSLELVVRAPAPVLVCADRQLIKRLMRNALDNAISYSREKTEIHLEADREDVIIHVIDDGPGFSATALRHFGQKRPTRLAHSEADGRISMGLGSVILLAIARLYDGEVLPSNSVCVGEVTGGRLKVRLRIVAPVPSGLNAA